MINKDSKKLVSQINYELSKPQFIKPDLDMEKYADTLVQRKKQDYQPEKQTEQIEERKSLNYAKFM